MKKIFNVSEEEKNRIRNLHLTEIENKKISSALNEAEDDRINPDIVPTDENPESQMSDAGDYHMWQNCAGGQVVALFDNQLQTVNGDSCHNAVNQGNPGLVLACTQALVAQFGTGPVLEWGIGGQHRSCWEYQGTQFFNTIPNAGSPSQGGSYTVPQTLSNCSQCSAQGELAWMCTDVGGGVGGTGCQQVTCPYPTVTNMPGQCWDNQIDCNNGGLNASLNAQPCGGYTGPEHECVNGQCIPWQNGAYPTLGACQAQCGGGTVEYCIDCAAQVMNYVPNPNTCPNCTQCSQLPGGTWVGIGPNPSPQQGPCVECMNNQFCTQGNGWTGSFNSMADCQASPNCSAGGYTCQGTQCVPDPNSTQTMAQCQANCPPTQTYDCNGTPSMNGSCQAAGSGGAFATMDDCLASPCNCDQWVGMNSGWNFYTSNPNNPSGNWYGVPHDGPSNQNALQNQLTNVQNSNAYLGGNVANPHYQKMKCREAAIQHWLGNTGPPMPCCDLATWGGNAVANGGNGDPLGCVTQNFIDLMNQNFIPNSPGWPGQGCNWLNNALTNVTNQQANFSPGTGGWCKTQGKIDFINNFKQTGQSTYVTGQASFPLPCV